jgi:hypothetical protein
MRCILRHAPVGMLPRALRVATWLGSVVMTLGAATPRAAAQVAPSFPDSGFGTIRGTVFDSLLGSPLAGAHVAVLRGTPSTETDRRGRYVLDSVPAGHQVVTFSHTALDSIGLSSFAFPVTVQAGGMSTLPLGVPSHATYWRAACGAPRRAGADSGIVFGTVRDAETGQRLSSARVAVTWLTVRWDSPRRWRPDWAVGEVWADPQGTYYLCGAPVEYLVTAQATSGRFSSGVVDVLVNTRGVVRRDLSVSREVLAVGPDSAPSRTSRGLATVIGTVRGERGGVLPGAIATLDDVADTARVDNAGRFTLRNIPSGSRMLMVRRVGYFAWRSPLDLRNRDTTRVEVALEEANVLDTIRVTAAPQMAAVLQEIDLRRLAGFGYVFGMAEIRQRPNLASVFEGLPSVQVDGRPDRFTLWTRATYSIFGVSRGGYCRMKVYIDGFLADEEQLATMMPQQVVVVEVYPRPSISLGRYADPLSPCGVVLVWTALAR